MANDFGLLLKAIVLEAPTGLEGIAVAAEGVPHQGQIEAAALLGLPDMGELVDEKALPMQRFTAEILGPQVGMGMEMDVPGRGHGHAARMEGPPLPPDHPHAAVIDRVAEDRTCKLDLSYGQRAGVIFHVRAFPRRNRPLRSVPLSQRKPRRWAFAPLAGERLRG